MPFIDSKISVPVSKEKQETIKSAFGKAVSAIGKPESYLMVGFEDNYDLFFAGKRVDKGAFVSVDLFGKASSDAYNKLTGEICSILEKELGLSGNNIYVAYRGTNDWGWDGRNF